MAGLATGLAEAVLLAARDLPDHQLASAVTDVTEVVAHLRAGIVLWRAKFISRSWRRQNWKESKFLSIQAKVSLGYHAINNVL